MHTNLESANKNHLMVDTPYLPVGDQKDEKQPPSFLSSSPAREGWCCNLSSLLRTPVSRHSLPFHRHTSYSQINVYEQK